MFNKLSNSIVCQYCHKNLVLTKIISFQSAIFSCQCTKYPLVEGILYIKKDKIRQILINKIIRDEGYLHLFAFSFRSRLFFKFINFKLLTKLLTFKKIMTLIPFLGYPIGFAKYIYSRNNIPSFFLSLLSFDFIKRSGITLDIGCAMGQHFPHIYKQCHPNNFIGIDKDFFNLYIAKSYFVKNSSILICCDVEDGLPLKNNLINNFFISDTLHYIRNANFFFKSLKKIVKKNAEGAIIHTLNIQVKSPPPCYKKRPSELKNILLNSGFKDFCILSSTNLWKQLNKSNNIRLNQAEGPINKFSVYNVLFAKRKVIRFRNYFQRLLKKTKVNFYQDKYLLNE